MTLKKQYQLIALLLLSACSKISSNEVETSSVYGEVKLKRSEASAYATASAVFFVGGGTGTVIELDSPASILINGHAGSKTNDPILNLTSYNQNVSTSLPFATFVYTDKEGVSYTNSLAMPGSFTASASAVNVSKAAGFSISYFGGTPFVSGESIEVTLSTSNGTEWVNSALVTGATSGSISIPPARLADLNPGALTVKACRESSPAAPAPYPKGTSVSISSCASSSTINLNP